MLFVICNGARFCFYIGNAGAGGQDHGLRSMVGVLGGTLSTLTRSLYCKDGKDANASPVEVQL